MSDDIQLSILVLTIPRRVKSGTFARITHELHAQIEFLGAKQVEILGLYDNKQRSVGAKRNALLSIAKGRFVTFVDDDDEVEAIYVERLLDQISTHPDADVIVFDTVVTKNGGPPQLCKYGVEFEYADTPKLWTGKPAHTMCWRADIAKRHQFPEKNFGEDTNWVKRACADVKNQVRIEGPPLYHYHYNSTTTETRS